MRNDKCPHICGLLPMRQAPHIFTLSTALEGYYYYPILQMRKGGSERLGNLPMVTQLVNGTVGIQASSHHCALQPRPLTWFVPVP